MIRGGLGGGREPKIASARSDVDNDNLLLHWYRSICCRAHLAVSKNRCLCKIASHRAMLRRLRTAGHSMWLTTQRNRIASTASAPVLALLRARLLQANKLRARVARSPAYIRCVRRRPLRYVQALGSEEAHVQGPTRCPPRRIRGAGDLGRPV